MENTFGIDSILDALNQLKENDRYWSPEKIAKADSSYTEYCISHIPICKTAKKDIESMGLIKTKVNL